MGGTDGEVRGGSSPQSQGWVSGLRDRVMSEGLQEGKASTSFLGGAPIRQRAIKAGEEGPGEPRSWRQGREAARRAWGCGNALGSSCKHNVEVTTAEELANLNRSPYPGPALP